MQHAIAVTEPFELAQTLTFLRRFLPSATETIVADDAVTAAITVDGRACAFTLRTRGTQLVAETPSAEVARRAADWIGAADDLRALYAAAAGDPPFAALVRVLHGLHQVRFLGLEDITAYSVMMQRASIARAVGYKRKFLERFGHRVEVGDRTLRAMPSLAELATLDGADIGAAIGHRPKGERIAEVARGVAAIGERYLREAPYEDAKRALLAIPGVGPFSAGAILLRGLGRTDELPSLEMFEDEGRAIYGRAWHPRAIAKRYGDQIGYWSFYLKTGAARLGSRGEP
jgi:DNA-3-methyladenine glycosylase II